MNARLIPLVSVVSALLLAGCSTPPVVSTSSTQTAAMIGQLQAETARFAKASALSDQSVLDTSKALQMSVTRQRLGLGEQLRAEEAAGHVERLQLFGRLKAEADGLKQDDTDLAAASAATDTEFASLLKPLPNASSSLAVASTSVEAIGKSPSTEQQLKETVGLLQGVWKATKENRDKLKAAVPAAQ